MTPIALIGRYAFTVSKGVSLSESLAPTNPIGFCSLPSTVLTCLKVESTNLNRTLSDHAVARKSLHFLRFDHQ
jgi:hypothetical protein